jgi:hypothetical protein
MINKAVPIVDLSFLGWHASGHRLFHAEDDQGRNGPVGVII